MKNFKKFYHQLEPQFKKNFFYILISYFLGLFAYPLIRSVTTALYMETFGAKATPKAWFLGVIGLTITIYICNRIQRKIGIHKLFVGICLFSLVMFGGSYFLFIKGFKMAAYIFFIWKEIYIVLLIHLILGFSNACFNLEQMKRLFSLVGAAGSIGGIIGGLMTSYLAKSYGTGILFYLSMAIIAANAYFFSKTVGTYKVDESKKDLTPLQSIKGIGGYVALVAAVVALSQFCINIGNLQFNLLFEKVVTSTVDKSVYLGKIYTIINTVSLFFQFFLIPYFFIRVSNKRIQLAVPVFYMIISSLGLGIFSSSLFAVAGTFILFKSTDYSIFAASKEILYHALSPVQKYGTKYITDMFVYRTSKALIALILIGVQSIFYVRAMLVVFLISWIICLIALFKKQAKLIEE